MSEIRRLFTTAPITRVRVSDEPHADVVAELQKGSEVEVHYEGEAFLQVSAWHPEQGKVSGWVHKSFVGLDREVVKEIKLPKLTLPPCNACGTENWVTMGYTNVGYHNSVPHLYLGFLESIQVKARVCLKCGQVQLCLDQKGMDQLSEWRRSNS